MVAAVLGGLWLVVLAPMMVSLMAERRQSSVAAFEASIRSLDRSASSALMFGGGPVRLRRDRRRFSRARMRRQQAIVGVAALAVLATVAFAVVRLDRSSLAAQAIADQVFVVYFAAVVASNQHRART